jgi:hypothetical protein
MTFFRQVPVLLLAAACSSGTPSTRQPAPSPGAPAPSVDPIRNTPVPEAAISYPKAGGGVARYSLARQDSLTAAMPTGERQVQLVGRTAFITVAWIAADTGTRVSVSIDSVLGESGVGFVQAALDSARGTRWSGLRLPNGQLTALSGAPRSQVGDQVRDELQLLFPILPPEGAQPGVTWSATVTGPVRVSAFEATDTAAITSQSGTVGPNGALDIGVVRSRSASGQGEQFGQPITVRATGSDTLTYRIAPDARVLSVSGVRSTALVIDLPSIGQSVPANERSAFQMTLIR